jgi:hypothetical protein
VAQPSIITGEKGKRVEFLALWKTMGRHVFIVTFFTAKEELFPPERKGVGLTFGNIALTDRVLHQLFGRLSRWVHFPFWGKERTLDHPIDHRQNYEVYN